MMKRKTAPLLVVVAACGVTATSAFAQAQQADTTLLPPVTVTATRVEGATASRTASATVLRAADLRDRGVTSVGEALRLVPSAAVVQVGSFGGETGVFMRGGERDFLLVMLDGVVLNEPGGFIDLSRVSIDNVDRIEVVRGPVSVLYGSDAVAGVVQIFTRRGTPGNRATVHASLGSFDTRTGELGFHGGGTLGTYSLAASRARTGGIHELNNSFRSDSYSAALSIGDAARTEAKLTARLNDGQYNYPTEFYGAPLDSNSYNYERRLSSGLEVSSFLSSVLQSRVQLGYTRQRFVFADPADAYTPFPFDSRGRTERRSAGAQLDYRGLGASIISIGGEYETQNSSSEGGETPAENPLLERWSRAVFGQLLSSVGRFDITAGARHDDNQRFGAFFTWRAAAGLALSEHTRLRGALGTGFREPQFSELSGGGFARPNPALNPEKSRSAELAIEQSMAGDRIYASATWFDQTFSDLIRFASIEGDPVYFSEYQNVERAIARGWELELRARPVAALHVSAAVTLLTTRIQGDAPGAGEPLARRPSTYGTASVQWSVSDVLSVGGDVGYTGRRSDTRYFEDFSSRPERMGGYARTDLFGKFLVRNGPFSDGPVEITLRIENALDRQYEAVPGFGAPGRRIVGGLRLQIGG